MPDFEKMLDHYSWPSEELDHKLGTFAERMIHHATFERVVQKVIDALTSKVPDNLIVVVGPSRVGKSSVRKALAGMLDCRAKRMGKPRGCFYFSLPETDGRGRINLFLAASRALRDAKEPLLEKKIVYGPITGGAPKKTNPNSLTRDERAMVGALVNNMREEHIPLIIDEASALAYLVTALQQGRAAHGFKDIMEDTGEPIVFIGTSEIKKLVELGIQLELRATIIRFDAYVDDSDNDQNDAVEDSSEMTKPVPREEDLPSQVAQTGEAGQNDDLPVNGLKQFCSLLKMIERELGEKFCEHLCLISHARDILRGIDGRSGVLFKIINKVLSDSGGTRRVTWTAFSKWMRKEIPPETLVTMQMERIATGAAIISAISMIDDAGRDFEGDAVFDEDDGNEAQPRRKQSGKRGPFKRELKNDKRSSHGKV
ncbi:AAA family ATPase [Paraburkholderia sediminicola]|uniref:AAA family ATPase n=1 Tax=Paraburkholderia sediminicola TaxID=458836 RepID=UPI0038B89AA5